MIFTEGDTTYSISFKHEQFEPTLMRLALPRMIHGRTTCYIRSQPTAIPASAPDVIIDTRVLGTGVSHVSASDPYDYAKGREISMKKALAMAWPTDKKKWHKVFNLYANRRKLEPPVLRSLRRVDDAVQQLRHQLQFEPTTQRLGALRNVLEVLRDTALRPAIKDLTPRRAA